jgi:7,8-didemethyl-8-hydroxy-5-deazariboflavin synthase CofG subunit
MLSETARREELLLRSEERELTRGEYAELFHLLKQDSVLPPRYTTHIISYSKKVFIPLTNLCRDSCGYCTFAKKPWEAEAKTYNIDEVIEVAKRGQGMGCKEALISLGDKPELAYPEYRNLLKHMGYPSTFDYIIGACENILAHTLLLPHVNGGTLSWSEMKELRRVSPSIGVMLESISERLLEAGGAHENCPDKHPKARIAMIKAAGNLRIPLTTGLLIGIGETEDEIIDSLLLLRRIQLEYGHIQEVIIQNFRPKRGTRMENWLEPDIRDFLAVIALARVVLGGLTVIQAPPNLARINPVEYVKRGVGDFGGISPLTADFINPEAPWPHIESFRRSLEQSGYSLEERLCVYPKYTGDERWIHPDLAKRVRLMQAKLQVVQA